MFIWAYNELGAFLCFVVYIVNVFSGTVILCVYLIIRMCVLLQRKVSILIIVGLLSVLTLAGYLTSSCLIHPISASTGVWCCSHLFWYTV